MLDTLRKMLLIGLGTTVTTKSKIQASLNRLVEQGKLTAEEADRLTREMMDTGETELSDLRAQINQGLERISTNLNLAVRSDLELLSARVENLEKRLDFLNDKVGRTLQSGPEQPDPEQG